MLNKQKERSKEMKCKKMRDIIASAALLLALAVPSAATGQSIDMGQSIDNFFFLNESEDRDGENFTVNEAEASWSDFDNGDPLPTGTGLLVLALSGACYAGAKMKRLKLKDYS